MALLQRYRNRLSDGKIAKSPRQFEDYILETLERKSCTKAELAVLLGKSTKQTGRYLTKLVERKKVCKLEGSHSWKALTSKDTIDSIKKQRIIENFTEFDTCSTIAKWRINNKSNGLEEKITWFRNLCFGTVVKEFKINPDFWDKEESTKLVVSLIKEKLSLSNSELIPHSHRMYIRSFILYGLQEPLSQAEAERLGISGEKSKPKLSTLHMTDSQYEDAKKELFDKKNNFSLQTVLKFGFRYGTFCRPSAMYLVKTKDLKFFDRIVPFVEVNGKKLTNAKVVDALSKDYEVKKYTHRACSLELYEPKQEKIYAKHILDSEIAKPLEEYAKQRERDGFKYLFWDNNETLFVKKTYKQILQYSVKTDNNRFKKLLTLSGFPLNEIEGAMKVNYFIRHFGVQKWLRDTDYNVDLIAEMGWESTDTLKTWYGKRTLEALQQKVAEIIY